MQRPGIVNMDGWVNVADLADGVTLYHKISTEEAEYFASAMPAEVNTVSVVDVKGGVRKTTASVNLALALNRYHNANARVLLADTDQYHSAQDWHDVAEATDDPWPDNVKIISVDGPTFHFDILDAAREYMPQYLVVDTPPNDEEASRRSLMLSDIELMPTGPFSMDIRRLAYGIEVGLQVAQMRGRPLLPVALLTNCKLGTKTYRAARQQFENWNLNYFNMPVRDLMLHAQSFGSSVQDHGDYDYLPKEIIPMFAQAKQLSMRSKA